MVKQLIKNIVKLPVLPAQWLFTHKLQNSWNALLSSDVSINERPAEYSFAMKRLMQICPKEVLDVGSGVSSWPHVMATCGFRVTAIDEGCSYWQGDYFNRHYYVMREDVTRPKLNKQFDFISCISVLEHIPDSNAAIDGMLKLLKKGGHLLLSFPYNENRYVENVYRLPEASYGQDAPYICQVYSRKNIDEWLSRTGLEIVDQEYYRIFSGDLWTFGKRVFPIESVPVEEKHHLTCVLLKKK